jgi:hypothetical protein
VHAPNRTRVQCGVNTGRKTTPSLVRESPLFFFVEPKVLHAQLATTHCTLHGRATILDKRVLPLRAVGGQPNNGLDKPVEKEVDEFPLARRIVDDPVKN